jgi:hypothetical protein
MDKGGKSHSPGPFSILQCGVEHARTTPSNATVSRFLYLLFSTVVCSMKVASMSLLAHSCFLSVGAGDNRGVFSMCDYSLHSVKSRPAKVGDKLTTRNFNTGTRGFAASEDASMAVCVLPGTELAFTRPVSYRPRGLLGWSVGRSRLSGLFLLAKISNLV